MWAISAYILPWFPKGLRSLGRSLMGWGLNGSYQRLTIRNTKGRRIYYKSVEAGYDHIYALIYCLLFWRKSCRGLGLRETRTPCLSISHFWIYPGIGMHKAAEYWLLCARNDWWEVIEMDLKVEKLWWEIIEIDFFHYIEKFSKSQRSKSGNKIFSNIPRKLLNWPRMTKIEVPLREKKRNYGIFVHIC